MRLADMNIRNQLATFAAFGATAALLFAAPSFQAGGQSTGGNTGGVTGATSATTTGGGQSTTGATNGTTGATTGQATTGQATTATTGGTTGEPTTGATTGKQTTGGAAGTGAQTTGSADPGQPNDINPGFPIMPGPSGSLPFETYGTLRRFGSEYFAQPRAIIERARAAAPTDDVANTFLGPDGLFSLGLINVTTPETYQLGPNDTLKIRWWSPTREVTEQKSTVDATGRIIAPGSQRQISVVGQTLSQVAQTIESEVAQAFRDAQVTVELDRLRTFPVTIIDQSFAPGTYQVPAVTTLFNLVYATGGPTERGSLRRIQIRRQGSTEMKEVDMYELLLSGRASGDVRLQPGDVILIPTAKTQVAVTGEVNRPAVYELLPGETLKKVLDLAGGVNPSGVSQSVRVESTVPGRERRIVDVDVLNDGGPNPVLVNGDIVDVYSIRPLIQNQVTIVGAVDQPRSYGLTAGMRVTDLIGMARGLLPSAYRQSAQLLRLNADETRTLISIDLQSALAGNEQADVLLSPQDILRIYDNTEIQTLEGRFVVLNGAVRNPGQYVRYEGMRVADLILMAGGLLPDANAAQAFLQRKNLDGTNGVLQRVNLALAAQGDVQNNVLLTDRDVLTIFTVKESTSFQDERVTIAGEVQRPGPYDLSRGMTVRDLIQISGGVTGKAFTQRAFLQRQLPNGTLGPLQIINVDLALAGDPEHDLPLTALDTLTIYDQAEVAFRATQTVRIAGAVARPGEYPKGQNMTLEDLILLAGGLLPSVGEVAEIAPSQTEFGAEIRTIPLDPYVPGGPLRTDPVMLNDGDIVTITTNGNYLERPLVVTIQGNVNQPGTYSVTERGTRLSDLVERAGGLMETAWVKGASFSRDPKHFTTNQQSQITPRLKSVIDILNEREYARSRAFADLQKFRITGGFTQPNDGNGVSALPGLRFTTTSTPPFVRPEIVDVDQYVSGTLVTRARVLPMFEPGLLGNLNVNVEEALRRNSSHHNMILRDGDIIYIPDQPQVVTVRGPGVFINQALVYEPGRRVGNYIDLAGGLTDDADRDYLLIIRANGVVVRPRMSTRVEPGDILFVPTKVQIARLSEKYGDVNRLLGTVTNGAILWGLLRNAVGG